MSIVPSCPHCQETTQQVKAGLSLGKQRFKCTHCQRRYLESPQVLAYPDTLHERALLLHATGQSMRNIARELQVNHQTVANWLRRELLPPESTNVPVPETYPFPPVEPAPTLPRESERKRATIRDVATHAAISTSTVSNYLNNRGYIHTDTAERIRTAIEELHFTPNALVRAVRQRRTHILGVLLFGVTELETNLISQLLLSGINEAADAAEYNILLYPGWLYRPQRHPGLSFLDGHIDGLIWVAPNWNEPVLEQVAKAGLPVVSLLSRHVPPDVGYANGDNIGGFQNLVHHFYQQGHRRIAWIGPAHSSNYSDRLLGYQQGIVACGLSRSKEREQVLTENIWEEKQYADAVDRCLHESPRPTVIMSADDGLAEILIRLLRQRGIRVPQEIAVAGANGLDSAQHLAERGLTTLRQPFRALANVAVENLLKKIAGAANEACCSTLPLELVPLG